MPRFVFLLLAGALSGALWVPEASAQPDFVRRVAPFPIEAADGAAFAYPFLGGLVGPRPQLADLDADGDADLLVLDEGGALLYFENVAAAGAPADFAWRTDAFLGAGLGVEAWYRAGDLDGDGDLDLLTASGTGPNRVRYLENTGTPQQPAFAVGADPLLDTGGEAVRAEPTNLPGLADLDGDGDLDYFAGTADLGTVVHYRHEGLDGDGVPRFAFVTDRFQDLVIFEESPTCPGDGLTAEEGTPSEPGAFRADAGGRHGQNAIVFADVDGDRDQDFFWGDFFTPSLLFFENEGTPTDPALVLASEVYPQDEPLTSGGYSVASFADTDGDGDLDLLVGIVGGFCFQPKNLVENLFFFENVGTATAPRYTERTGQRLPSYDAGRRATPALGDLDGDGDLDALVGTDLDPALAPPRAALRLLENVGSERAPRWREADPDVLGLDLGVSATAYTPALGDLTGDGRADLVVGEFGRALFLFRRTDAPLASPDAFVEVTPNPFEDLALGQRPAPALGDLDGDGDADLLVGDFNGRLRFFRNTGTPRAPAFVLADDRFLDLDAGTYSTPRLADVDADGDLDLFVGAGDGPIRFFRNAGTPQAADFVAEGAVPAARGGTAPALGDLDGDGDADLVSGALGGGLLYFENPRVTDAAPTPTVPALRFEAWPNPARGPVRFAVDVPAPLLAPGASPVLTVYDALGRVVFERALPVTDASAVWPGTDAAGRRVAAGVYLARLAAGGTPLATRRLTRLP